jgi:hypothetical protein
MNLATLLAKATPVGRVRTMPARGELLPGQAKACPTKSAPLAPRWGNSPTVVRVKSQGSRTRVADSRSGMERPDSGQRTGRGAGASSDCLRSDHRNK